MLVYECKPFKYWS